MESPPKAVITPLIRPFFGERNMVKMEATTTQDIKCGM